MNFDLAIEEKIRLVASEYLKSSNPWVIGYSGGKDSSLVVKVFYQALLRVRKPKVPVHIVYCDTAVEIPVVAAFVKGNLSRIQNEARQDSLPLQCHVATPALEDSFFVRLIGRGYPPPTNKFRWCTDKLRIRPIQRLMERVAGTRNTVVLGVRSAESEERQRVLTRHATTMHFYYRQSTSQTRMLFCPIVDLDTETVWEGLFLLPRPSAIDVRALGVLYKQAGGECPVVREVQGSPCGQGRFGCWTCTVVRKDRAVMGLVKEGHSALQPLLDFRNWLLLIRDEPEYRCSVRRNGAHGLGPFRISARRQILKKLLATQKLSGLSLIDAAAISLIQSLWKADLDNPRYAENAA